MFLKNLRWHIFNPLRESPIIKFNNAEFLLFAIRDFSDDLQDFAIAWSEFGEPVYFKRGVEYEKKLYLLSDGEEEILIENTENLNSYSKI